MADISLEALGGKLNRVGYQALFQALRHAKNAGNRRIELAHWLLHILQQDRCDLALTLDRSKIARARVIADVTQAVDGFRGGQTEMPDWSKTVFDAIERGWLYATLAFGETQVRTGHVLVGILRTDELRRTLSSLSAEFAKLNADTITDESRTLWAGSEEDVLQPMDGSGVTAGRPGAAGEPKARGQTALDRFSQDLTAKAAEGGMDPVLGRDEEIRQVIDVLLRRRQNNPILTGEAGVGKTAVAEGLAQRIAAGDVPSPLKGVRLLALDIGLMQAGASMKGEFEQRLRSVIDEVQASPTPIILFIDEAHTLIGAGGAAGTGDAANLMKPPLARGTLRTIAATTWSEYRQYIEKDPALTRRFQPIQVDEPDAVRCARMLRGVIGPMEAHHKVRIADAAVVAAVELSQRAVPARQLPDKAVSLRDTACARVAISQTAVPAAIADAQAGLAALEKEKAALVADRALGVDSARRLAEIEEEHAALAATLAGREAEWEAEKRIVADLADLRARRAALPQDGPADQAAAIEAELAARAAEVEAIPAERRMIYAYVDAQAVASVISDWTGIPVGRMVKNEIDAILNLPEVLNRRVIGQSHGLAMIAKRIETSRAKLDNPSKPIGVFLLCGPSGVGKTETALTLAEALYGGEQNVITINMSEFQEAHTVSSLKGGPPRCGLWQGGALTEAVRRKPYSVVLLDEVEKAHPDVHELFFQVFDKGVMEDGNGRRIDFRNTLIILTSNVGTDLIMDLARNPAHLPDAEALAAALRPELLKVFPPASSVGWCPSLFPLSPDMLTGIVRLQLDRIGKRIRDNHKARFTYDEEVVAHIVAQCNDPDSGGRMIDNSITNSLLPALSREFLKAGMAGEVSEAKVGMGEGGFVYVVR